MPLARFLTALLLTGLLAASAEDLPLTERLGQSSEREFVALPFAGQASGALISPSGAAIPWQADGGAIAFIAEPLTAQQTAHYRFAEQATASSPLQVNKQADSVTINTGGVEARFPLGQGKDQPPAPLLGMRFDGGPWAPASEWTKADAIQSWSSELLAEGPVFAKVRISYVLKNGGFASFTATLYAGDNTLRWRQAVSGDAASNVLTMRLPAVPGVKQAVLPKGYGQWAKQDSKVPVNTSPTGFVQLSPNSSVLGLFPQQPWKVVLGNDSGQRLELASADPGAWVTPIAPQTYYGQPHWSLPMIGAMWAGWQGAGVPVIYQGGEGVSLSLTLAKGAREWTISDGPAKVGTSLQAANAMTLAWDESAQHPLLFLDAADLKTAVAKPEWAALAQANPDAAVKKLREQLALMGNFDVMRYGVATAALYDAVIDTPQLSATDRALFRAQMAWLGYLLADPQCWSSERGFGSGNPNMHCSYILTLGVVACALRDHPMAENWANYAADWFDHWLETEVGPNGEWIPEGAHYGNISLEIMLSYAIAAQRAGHRDFTADPRFKRLIAFFAQTMTPPSPQHGDVRVTPNYGRGVTAERLATMGIAARMTAKTDPDFSANLQWLWAQTGFSDKIGDYRLGGLAPHFLDRSLPQKQPTWASDHYPELGAVFRAHYGQPQESFVNFLAGVGSERNLDVWTPSVTDIAQWFGQGAPLSSCFIFAHGGADRHELISEGVQLARNYQPGASALPFGYYTTTDFSAFATLPLMDYARTSRVNTKADNRGWTPPKLPAYPTVQAAKSDQLTVTRQVAFMRDNDPAVPAYLVIRDTTSGGEPTAWQFWSLTQGLDIPGKKLSAGDEIHPARQLPAGSRYAATGQFGVDLEYFVAAPADTPRHTLRYGAPIQHQKISQFQDLLHLQLPGDGAYFVALYPRAPDRPAPEFTTDRSQQIIKVAHAAGADYVFLSADDAKASLDDATFSGTAASARVFNVVGDGDGSSSADNGSSSAADNGNSSSARDGSGSAVNGSSGARDGSGAVNGRGGAVNGSSGAGHELTLAARGRVEFRQLALEAPFAAALRVTGNRLTLTTDASSPGGEVRLSAPGDWSRVKALAGPGSFSDSMKVTLPAGAVDLIYEKR